MPLPLFHPLLCKAAPPTSSASSSAAPSGTATPSGPSRTNPLATVPLNNTEKGDAEAGSAATATPTSDSLAKRLVNNSSRPRPASKKLPAPEPGAVAPTKGTWDWVSRNGLGGLTGQAADRFRARYGEGEESSSPERRADQQYREEEGPEREIRAFVEKRWRIDDGWETAWYVEESHSRFSPLKRIRSPAHATCSCATLG